jgi:hypothetical protein
MGNLNNLYISQSFQSLAHLGTDNALVPGTMTELQDGIGQSLNISFDGTNISSSGNIFAANLTGSFNSSSLLTTASANINVITFTKGDGSTFDITVIASGSVVPGTISGSAQITALGFVSSSVTASSLITASFNNGTRNLTFTKGDNTTFAVNIPDVSGSAGNFVTTSSFNTYTSSTNTRLSNIESTTASLNISVSQLNAATSSYATSTITASSLITASINNSTNTITFTKGDSTTFDIVIQTGSVSPINTGSFATTGSNTFVGNQTISGSLFVSGSEVVAGPVTASRLQINGVTDLNGTLDVLNDATFRGDVLIQSSGEQKLLMRSTSGGGVSQGFDLLIQTSSFIIRDETHDIDFFEFDYISSSAQHILKLEANRFELNSGSLGVSGSLTASLQEGYVWAGGAGNVSTLVATSSFGGGGTIDTGSLVTTASFNAYTQSTNVRLDNIESTTASLNSSITQLNANTASQQISINSLNAATASYVTETESGSFLITASFDNGTRNLTFTKGDITTFAVNIPAVSGSTIDTGSFATTGSNSFNGSQIITGSITTTQDITVSGVKFGFGNPAGTSSIAIGVNALNNNLGQNNTALGTSALQQNTTGIQNMAFGFDALQQNTTGDSNTAIGTATGRDNQTGIENVFIGWISGINAGNVSQNIIIGARAGQSVKSSDNTIIGHGAASAITSGSSNTLIGKNSGANIGSGSNNTLVGTESGADISGSNNTLIGRARGIGSWNNVIALSDGAGNIRAQFIGNEWDLTGSLDVSSSFTASLQEGFTYVGNASGRTIAVSTSSFASTINTGSFATTGSNSFIGNQIITGNVTISGSATTDLTVVGQIYVSSSATGQTTQPRIIVSGSSGQSTILRNNINTTNGLRSTSITPNVIFNADSVTGDDIGFVVSPSAAGISGWTLGPAIYVNNTAGDTYPAVFGFQNKANYTDGRVSVLTPLSASAGFTASLQNGFAWVGNALGQNTQVATSSFGGGGTIDTGSFATTGSNTFTGNQIISGTIFISSSTQNDVVVNGQVFISSSAIGGTTQPRLTVSGSAGTSTINRNSIRTNNLTDAASLFPAAVTVNDLVTADEIGVTVDPAAFSVSGWTTGPAIYVNNDAGDTYPAVFGFQNKANYTDGRVTVLTPLSASAGIINARLSGSTTITGSLLVKANTTFATQDNISSNIILGLDAMINSIGATDSIAIGNNALRYASGSQQNLAFGKNALLITSGSNNFALGNEALASNTTGNQNVALGIGALSNNTTGNKNLAIGNDAGIQASGSQNIFIGASAGSNITGSNNTIIGSFTGTAGSPLNNNIILADGQGNVKAQYSGSAWSFQDDIKFNKGSNKTCDIVTVGSGGTLVSNSLVTTNSIILATTQNSEVGGDEYPAVVSSKSSGQFYLNHNYGGNLLVAYLIINPTV